MNWNLDDLIRRHLFLCLLKNNGNIMVTSGDIGVNYKTIYNWINKYDLIKVFRIIRCNKKLNSDVKNKFVYDYGSNQQSIEDKIIKAICDIQHDITVDRILNEVRVLQGKYEKVTGGLLTEYYDEPPKLNEFEYGEIIPKPS